MEEGKMGGEKRRGRDRVEDGRKEERKVIN